MDDHNDPVHLERVSTMNFIQVDDLGALPPHGMKSQNYTHDEYRINEWYRAWMKEQVVKKQDALTTYQVNMMFIDEMSNSNIVDQCNIYIFKIPFS